MDIYSSHFPKLDAIGIRAPADEFDCVAPRRAAGDVVVDAARVILGKTINRSHTHTPTENNTPDNDTHTRTRREQHPKRTPPTDT